MSTERKRLEMQERGGDWSNVSEFSGAGREQNNKKKRRDWPQNITKTLLSIAKGAH